MTKKTNGVELFSMNEVKACDNAMDLEINAGGGQSFIIKVIGANSDKVRDYSISQYKKFNKKSEIAKKQGKEYQLSDDEIKGLAVENAMVRVVGWSGVLIDGKPADYDAEKMENWLHLNPTICKRIVDESEDLGNFIKA